MVKYGAYSCAATNLTEWLVPIDLEGQWLGAVITGQFVDLDALDATHAKLEERGWKKSKNELRNHVFDPAMQKAFFQQVHRFKKFVKKEREDSLRLTQQNIYKEMRPYLQGIKFKEPVYRRSEDTNSLKEFPQLTGRFRHNRTRLFEACIVFKHRFGLVGMHIFKPTSKIDGMTEINILKGANLDEYSMGSLKDEETKDRERPFTTTEYTLDLSSLKKQLAAHVENNDADKTLIEALIKEPVDMLGVLFNDTPVEATPEFDHAIMMVYATAGLESHPVAHVLFFENQQAKEEYLEHYKKHNVLGHASAVYLANWYALYADYHRCVSEVMNQFVTHELRNVQSGMQLDLIKLDESYKAIKLANRKRLKELRELFTELDKLILGMENYIPSAGKHHKLVSLITEMTDSGLLTREPDLSQFWPNTLLNTLCYTYDPLFRDSSRRVIGPKTVRGEHGLVDIVADSKLFEMVAHNLIHNAYKYSFDNTNTFVQGDFRPNDGVYRLTVISYGSSIPEKERDRIFEMGYRIARDASTVGVGMGLYLVKNIAEKLKGRAWVESTLICDYHPAYLHGLYHMVTRNEIEPSNYLSQADIDKYENAYLKYANDNAPNPGMPVYTGGSYKEERRIARLIEEPTACNKFIVEIPLEARNERKNESTIT
jgi:signal transduction histidine kinase